jgi:hypothetical protein
MQQLPMSARAFHRIRQLARTIAGLAGRVDIETLLLAAALQYRPRRQAWKAGWRCKAEGYPPWANRAEQESCTKSGLIICEAEPQRIVGLSAMEALSVLERLRSDDSWEEHGLVVGSAARLW